MTAKLTSDDPPEVGGSSRRRNTKSEDVVSETVEPCVPEPDAAAARASVHEAIGKLIGDDAERRRGTADKEACGITPENSRKPPPSP